MLKYFFRYFPRFMTRTYILRPAESSNGKNVLSVIRFTPAEELKKDDLVQVVRFFNFFSNPIFISIHATLIE